MKLPHRTSRNHPSTNSPPPPIHLHTTHLTPTQQTLLAHNPTYTTHLAALTTLATQVHRLQTALAQRNVGKLPDIAASALTRSERNAFERPPDECRVLEEKLWRWDDELAGLAEVLLARPRFGVGEEVVWWEDVGSWWWRVPDG